MVDDFRENGADFYGLPRNEDYVELEKNDWMYVVSYIYLCLVFLRVMNSEIQL